MLDQWARRHSKEQSNSFSFPWNGMFSVHCKPTAGVCLPCLGSRFPTPWSWTSYNTHTHTLKLHFTLCLLGRSALDSTSASVLYRCTHSLHRSRPGLTMSCDLLVLFLWFLRALPDEMKNASGMKSTFYSYFVLICCSNVRMSLLKIE